MNSTNNSIIEVRNLTIQRDTLILDNIDWTVSSGEQWVILGANGSGKTTLLNTLNAYVTPTRGTIRVCGREFGKFDWRELRKSIGIVSTGLGRRFLEDEPGIQVVVSGRRSEFNTWERTPKAWTEEALELMNRMGLSYLKKREWRFFSQGERQRMLIARALMTDYQLLILDEPCAGLDPVARENFLRFLEKLMQGEFGTRPAVAMVTHHVEEITPQFTHALTLKNGRNVGSGPIQKILNSKLLSEVFSAEVRLIKGKKGFALKVEG